MKNVPKREGDLLTELPKGGFVSFVSTPAPPFQNIFFENNGKTTLANADASNDPNGDIGDSLPAGVLITIEGGFDAGLARLRAYAAKTPDSGLSYPFDWRAQPVTGNRRRSTIAGIIERSQFDRYQAEYEKSRTDAALHDAR